VDEILDKVFKKMTVRMINEIDMNKHLNEFQKNTSKHLNDKEDNAEYERGIQKDTEILKTN
jgi:hypothetical protein